jgi:hypothetical protein
VSIEGEASTGCVPTAHALQHLTSGILIIAIAETEHVARTEEMRSSRNIPEGNPPLERLVRA